MKPMIHIFVMSVISVILIATAITFTATDIIFAQQLKSRIGEFTLSNDQPIQIESDQMNVNNVKSTAVFSGNVKVLQGNTLLQSQNMTIYYENGGSVSSGAADINKIEIAGNVVLKSGTQTATADRGSFNMVSQILVLSGEEVILTDGDNVFSGCKLTVEMASGDAALENCGKSVIIQLDPKSKK